jgi:hypothetical protein
MSVQWRVFKYAGTDFGIRCEGDDRRDIAIVREKDDAEYIVRCVNSHTAMALALEAAKEYLQHPGGEHLPAGEWFRLNERIREALRLWQVQQ